MMNMLKKSVLLAMVVALTVGVGTAHTNHDHQEDFAQVDRAPNVIGASSPLYGLDVSADNVGVALGLTDRGAVIHERATEALEAAEQNRTQARERAVEQMNQIAAQASSDDTEGLNKASAVLEAVRAETPDAANQGIDEALGNVEEARNRAPSDGGSDAGGNGNNPAA